MRYFPTPSLASTSWDHSLQPLFGVLGLGFSGMAYISSGLYQAATGSVIYPAKKTTFRSHRNLLAGAGSDDVLHFFLLQVL